MKQFSGRDEYWDRVIAAQQGWPQKQLSDPFLEPPVPSPSAKDDT